MADKANHVDADHAEDRIKSTSAPLSEERSTDPSDRELNHIRENIRQTEAEMADTLSALEEKLVPSRLMDQAKEEIIETALRRSAPMIETAGNKMRNIGETIKEKVEGNPIPVTLLGLGLGWLLVDGIKRRDRRTGWSQRDRYHRELNELADRERHEAELYPSERSMPSAKNPGESRDGGKTQVRDALDKARRTGTQYAEQLQHTARHYGHEAQQQVGDLKHRANHLTGEVHHQYRRARRAFSEVLHDNPLLVGAAALTVGALAGFLIPETQREHEWMGETRDSLLEKGYETGREMKAKAKRVMRETGRAAADEADKQDLTPEGIKEGVEKIMDEAGRTVSEKVDEEISS